MITPTWCFHSIRWLLFLRNSWESCSVVNRSNRTVQNTNAKTYILWRNWMKSWKSPGNLSNNTAAIRTPYDNTIQTQPRIEVKNEKQWRSFKATKVHLAPKLGFAERNLLWIAIANYWLTFNTIPNNLFFCSEQSDREKNVYISIPMQNKNPPELLWKVFSHQKRASEESDEEWRKRKN